MHTPRTVPPLPPPLQTLFEARIETGEFELPFLPDTPAQVLAASNDDDCDARVLADLVQRDQALAGHVLHVANSSAYAPQEPIVSLQQAVSRLGLGTVAEIALAVSIKGKVFRVPGYQVKIREMWMHSAMTAAYAKEIARLRRHNVESAFMGGLLHDVGKPIVLQAFLDTLKELTQKKAPMKLLESCMLQFHERVGGQLVAHWELPDWMRASAEHHHEYELAEEFQQEAMTTHLADRLAHWAADEEATAADFDRDLPVISDLNIYGDEVEELLQRRGDVLEVAEAFL